MSHIVIILSVSIPVPIEIVGDTNIDGNNGSGRRVLGLIKTLNESFSDYDFLLPVWETVKYEATAIAEGDLKAATLMANLTQHTSRELTCDSRHEGLCTRTSLGIVHFLPNRGMEPQKKSSQLNASCAVCADSTIRVYNVHNFVAKPFQ